MNVIVSFCGLCLLLVAGKWLRVHVRLFQRLYLPSSVLGGFLGLLVLQLAGGRLPEGWTAGWSALPGLLINVVFASLFLSVSIPSLRQIWRLSGTQLAYGQIVAWGQYVVGLGMVLVLLNPWFAVPALFGVIVPVGFEGGHGTAAGLYIPSERPSAGKQTVTPPSIDTLALHLALVGMAMLIGIGIKQGLAWIEQWTPWFADGEVEIMGAFPRCHRRLVAGMGHDFTPPALAAGMSLCQIHKKLNFKFKDM